MLQGGGSQASAAASRISSSSTTGVRFGFIGVLVDPSGGALGQPVEVGAGDPAGCAHPGTYRRGVPRNSLQLGPVCGEFCAPVKVTSQNSATPRFLQQTTGRPAGIFCASGASLKLACRNPRGRGFPAGTGPPWMGAERRERQRVGTVSHQIALRLQLLTDTCLIDIPTGHCLGIIILNRFPRPQTRGKPRYR